MNIIEIGNKILYKPIDWRVGDAIKQMTHPIIEKVEEYAEKHDLSAEEKTELGRKLVEDQLLYGNAYLDMEEGYMSPKEAKEKVKMIDAD